MPRRVSPPDRCISLPGGTFVMGTDNPVFRVDGEAPSRRADVGAFAVDPFAVTNAWFSEFVANTGYVTEAERWGWSFVFFSFLPGGGGGLERPPGAEWWRKVDGATWRQPEGPGSSIAERGDHPVVHVSWKDAAAFAAWAGGRLPTEAEWEYAAHGGQAGARYPWGNAEPGDEGPFPCNIWQGRFPDRNTGRDGFVGTAPVDAFAPNPLGIHQMAGNVWEWCADNFRVPSIRRDLKERDAVVMKGGSYLCHASYCHRYRIAARTGSPPDSTTGHAGFRVVFDVR
jgi:formylglycine-generating enzyme required for sulfatase activity